MSYQVNGNRFTVAGAAPWSGVISFVGLDGKVRFRIEADNSITLGDGFTVDDAAKEFWRAVERFRPVSAKTEVGP